MTFLALHAEQADGLDVADQLLLAERHHLGRGLDDLEQRRRGAVDADVGRLRREHDGDQQMIDVVVFQLGLGLRHRLLEAGEEFRDDGLLHQGHIAS